MRAASPTSVKVLTCPYDTEEPKAEFTISLSIPYGVRNELLDEFSEMSEVLTKGGSSKPSKLYSVFRKVVKSGLKGFKGLYGRGGDVLSMNGQVTDQLLDELSEIKLPGTGFENIINWLGSEIWAANTLPEQEKKTSDVPSSFGSTSPKPQEQTSPTRGNP